jgi:hypothetical protein
VARWVVLLAVAGSILVALMAAPVGAATPAVSAPQLYYTTNFPPRLKVVTYLAEGDRLAFGTPSVVTNLPAADGLAVLADGSILVGGSLTGQVFRVNPDTGTYTSQPAGMPTAYHVSLSADGSTAWTAGLPGQLAALPTKPFGPGKVLHLKGDDLAVTTIGFSPLGTFYTSSDSRGSGNFGTIDLKRATTKRTLTGQRGAHGFTYDPFTKDVVLVGSYNILQIDPTHPDQVVSERVVPGMAFDQGAVDGQGHLLAASNTGDVVFVDYASTSQVGSKGDTMSKAFLDTNLDDLATRGPLVLITGASGASAGGGGSKVAKLAPLLGVAALLVAGLVLFMARRSRKPAVLPQ